MTAAALERKRRAFTPWPGLFTRWQGKVLKLLDVVPLPTEAGGPSNEPGQLVPLDLANVPVGIVTTEGILGLKILQLEGRRAAAAGEFLKPESTERRLWGQSLKKPEGAPLNLG